MIQKTITWSICTVPLLISAVVSADIISIDWKISGDDLITQDTVSGLEWLDLTATSNLSRNYVSSQLGVGGEFTGWRFATGNEVASFFDAFGGIGPYDGWSADNNGLFDLIAPYWGDLYCETASCSSYVPGHGSGPGLGYSRFFIADFGIVDQYYYGELNDKYNNTAMTTYDWVTNKHTWIDSETQRFDYGSALVRDSHVVPIPAASWLFTTGLIGLIGISLRKKDSSCNS